MSAADPAGLLDTALRALGDLLADDDAVKALSPDGRVDVRVAHAKIERAHGHLVFWTV